ncbi:iron complex transport system ATP-binding protein [Sphingomonas sp. BE138]|uniref:ABC transporter ATP-binding protein n=1 Tax=Sphingomonas sp. BE138 TaxID=2817845 RepID=UPI0028620239|nr:ABC transporter ATP-binding protein [Sphingomonas sp. BE138]MDR6789628.1 iron complex transport system ATP-binding protein [Sphingomonas sp. BE138]
MSVLAAHGLSLSLGGKPVLDAVDAQFASGRVTALLGANGAGKSSLLACLAGLRHPDAGEARLGGDDLRAIPAQQRARRIGFLPQAADVHWNVDVATLVGLGRLPWRGRWGETTADRAAVDAALAATGMTAFARRGVEHLSGGERARALLARVLAGTPEWLLADEPLASLDPAHQLEVGAQLRTVAAAGGGVVLVVHDLNLAARLADDVVLLRDGGVVAAGPVDATLDAERIGRTYGVAVETGTTATGQRYIVPVRAS